MPERSDQSDDDNQSRKRQLLSNQSESSSSKKRKRPSASTLDRIFSFSNSLWGMFRKEKPSDEEVLEDSDDFEEEEQEEVVVLSNSPRKSETSRELIYLNSDERTTAGNECVQKTLEVSDESDKEKEEEVVVEKHIQKNVEISDESDDGEEIQEIERPSVSTPVKKSQEVQRDEDLTVQFVKIVKTPNKALENARLYQNEIIFLNTQEQEDDDDGVSSTASVSALPADFTSPTPDDSVSRPMTPNGSMFAHLNNSSNVRDYWRRSAAKKPSAKRTFIRRQQMAIPKMATSQIQKVHKNSEHYRKTTNRHNESAALARYKERLSACGYIPIVEESVKKNTKVSASLLIAKAKNKIAGINGSRSTTPSIQSRESSVIYERTISRAETPSTSSEANSKNAYINEMLSRIRGLGIAEIDKNSYLSAYQQGRLKEDSLHEEVRIREGHREQTAEERREEVKKRLAARGIIVRPKEKKKPKDEFVALPDSVDALVQSAWSGRNKEELFVDAFSIQIHRKDLQTLSGLNWLNDNVINYYLQLINQRSSDDSTYPKVHAFNTFFYTNVVDKGYASVRRWTRKVDIFAHDILLIPVHLGMHWCMAVIDVGEKRIEFYDSLYNGNTVVLPALKGYLASESLDKKKTAMDFTGWTIQQMEDIPRQRNGSDCGVFSCQFGEWASRRKRPEFSQQHMPYYRKRMVHEIVSKRLLATL